VCFEDLSFPEQVRLMADTEVLVGPSGAALTNLMFMPPGAKVLVLVEPVQVSVFFWTMADALGHEYWYATGETVPGEVPPPADPDLRIAPELLQRHLAAMLGS
jgi:capsular polysaccharide biosynthesis protein